MDNQSLYPNGSLPDPNNSLISSETKIILCSISLVWILVGNVLVIIVIFRNEGLRTNFNYLIVNMAISDLSICFFSLPMSITAQASGTTRLEWFVGGALGNVLCKLCNLLGDMSPAVSVFTLLVISVNRLIAIVFPLRAQMFSKKKGCLLILATWVMAFAVYSPYLYVFQLKTDNNINRCVPLWPTLQAQSGFISAIIMILFLIPMIIITLVYSFLIYKFSRGSKTVNNMLNNQQAESRRQRNRQIFYISIAIVASFILLWGPFFSFLSVTSFIWKWKTPLEPRINEAILFIVTLLGYLNAGMNPCICFLFLKNYRQGLKRLFDKKKFRRCSETQTFYTKTVRSNVVIMSGANTEDPQCKLMNVQSIK